MDSVEAFCKSDNMSDTFTVDEVDPHGIKEVSYFHCYQKLLKLRCTKSFRCGIKGIIYKISVK